MYHVLHIPTNQLLEATTSKGNGFLYCYPTIATFKSKAQAGKAIEKYRLGVVSKDYKLQYKYKYQVYLFSSDYVLSNIIIKNIPYIRLTTRFMIYNPIFNFKPIQWSLSIPNREKLSTIKKFNFFHKSEFLIMEVI